ncbi:MAG: carbon-nitrogen hydrolase family protein [Comamonas sp.]|nr:carbon-nitrogen hydrolase family protein [Comamonas sp.]
MPIAIAQMCSSPNVADNLAAAHTLIAQAAAQGAELVVLPEYFCAMGLRDSDKLAWCEDFGQGVIQDSLARAAQDAGLWLIAGTLPLRALPLRQAQGDLRQAQGEQVGKVYNSSLVFSPEGECTARYDKMHLFRFQRGAEAYDESVVIEAGAAPVTTTITDRSGHPWRVGLSVCYDLRFPELYRQYALAGAELVVVPSAFTYTTGQAHWEVLLRARAIENQCYVLAAAQGGKHENGRRTWGHSMAVSPWGQVLAQRSTPTAGLVLASLDSAVIAQARSQLPALEHRRL